MGTHFGDYMNAVKRPAADHGDASSVRDWMKEAPEAAKGHADMLARDAAAITEQVKVSPLVSDAMSDYVTNTKRHAEQMGDVSQTFHRAHAEDFAKIDRNDPRERAWDVSKNN